MNMDYTSKKGEQTYSLSNKELRAVEVLFADSGMNIRHVHHW